MSKNYKVEQTIWVDDEVLEKLDELIILNANIDNHSQAIKLLLKLKEECLEKQETQTDD